MTESTTQTSYGNGNSPAMQKRYDGFQVQEQLLSKLSTKLDEYFALKSLNMPE